MKYSYKNTIYINILLAVTMSSVALASDKNKDMYLWFSSMAEALNIVNAKSYFPMTFEQAIVKSLDAFVHMDEYSHFLSPKEYKELIKNTKGEFFGIGVILAQKRTEDDFLLILDIIPGSPAYNKGLQRYDKIIAIDETPIATLSAEEAINKLKGEIRHSTVTIDIIRNTKDLLSITLERDLIKENNISCYYLPQQKIAYCAISLFTQQIAEQLESSLAKILVKNPIGIIIDLRDNAGGVLQAAVDCASLFLPKESLIALTKDRNKNILQRFRTKKIPILTNFIPVFVIVNEYTASAAEILAGALKIHSSKLEYKRNNPYIFLVGTKTFGKGSVQEIIPMNNSCALKITTCIYALPDNSCIQTKGITPDFTIEQKYPPTPEIKLISSLYGRERNTQSDNKVIQPKNISASTTNNWKSQKD